MTQAIRNVADYGRDPDPAYQALKQMVAQTLVDVGLAVYEDAAAAMQLAEEDKHAIVFVLFDRAFTDPALTDAIMALLGSRAPQVYWYVVGEQPEPEDDEPLDMGVTVIGSYPAGMSAEAITVIT